MKKSLLLFFFLLSSFPFLSFAQDVQNVTMKFCNDGLDKLSSSYMGNLAPGKAENICLLFVNAGTDSIQINYEFPTARLDQGTQLCDLGNAFGEKYLDKKDRTVVLKPRSQQQISEKIRMPIGMSGIQYGCLTYSIGKPVSANMGGMFNLIVRKTANLNVLVGGESTISKALLFHSLTGGSYSSSPQFSLFVDNKGEATLRSLVKNDGNISLDVALSGILYNFLGFQKDFSFATVKFMPGEEKEISAVVGILPAYKGIFSLQTNVVAVPFFDFDVSTLNKSVFAPLVDSFSATFFVFSWIWVILIVIVLLIIAKVLFPKKKKDTPISPSPVV